MSSPSSLHTKKALFKVTAAKLELQKPMTAKPEPDNCPTISYTGTPSTKDNLCTANTRLDCRTSKSEPATSVELPLGGDSFFDDDSITLTSTLANIKSNVLKKSPSVGCSSLYLSKCGAGKSAPLGTGSSFTPAGRLSNQLSTPGVVAGRLSDPDHNFSACDNTSQMSTSTPGTSFKFDYKQGESSVITAASNTGRTVQMDDDVDLSFDMDVFDGEMDMDDYCPSSQSSTSSVILTGSNHHTPTTHNNTANTIYPASTVSSYNRPASTSSYEINPASTSSYEINPASTSSYSKPSSSMLPSSYLASNSSRSSTTISLSGNGRNL